MEEHNAQTLSQIDTLVMPNVKPRGRPRGKKCTQVRQFDRNTKVPLKDQSQGVIIAKMIKCLVKDQFGQRSKVKGQTLIDLVLSKQSLLTKDHLPNFTSNCDLLMDSTIDLNLLKTYMEEEAFSIFCEKVYESRKQYIFRCLICQHPSGQTNRAKCVACLRYAHFNCIGGQTKRLKHKSFLCSPCKTAE